LDVHPRHGIHQFLNAPEPLLPLANERTDIGLHPVLHRSQAAHDLLFADFHRAAQRAFPRAGVGERGVDQKLMRLRVVVASQAVAPAYALAIAAFSTRIRAISSRWRSR